jgi:hypothetical protein
MLLVFQVTLVVTCSTQVIVSDSGYDRDSSKPLTSFVEEQLERRLHRRGPAHLHGRRRAHDREHFLEEAALRRPRPAAGQVRPLTVVLAVLRLAVAPLVPSLLPADRIGGHHREAERQPQSRGQPRLAGVRGVGGQAAVRAPEGPYAPQPKLVLQRRVEAGEVELGAPIRVRRDVERAEPVEQTHDVRGVAEHHPEQA